MRAVIGQSYQITARPPALAIHAVVSVPTTIPNFPSADGSYLKPGLFVNRLLGLYKGLQT
jgi:hypothetical protein